MLVFWVSVIGFAFGIAALATGVAAARRTKRSGLAKTGHSIAGITLGVAATIIGGAVSIWAFYVIFSYQDCIGHAGNRSEYSRC